MSIITVTPTLSVNEADFDTFTDLDAATEAIRQGERVMVTTMWEAEQVLRNLGMDEQSIQQRINFALTGSLG